jgi:hypothetical protein
MFSRGRMLVALPVFVAAGVALAQAARQAEDVAPGATADDEQIEQTAPEQFAKVAEDTLAAMRATLQKGLDEVKSAREEKDAVRLTCVNEPVTTMKGLMSVGDDANTALQEALVTKDTSDARREFRKLVKSAKRMEALLLVARSCAGAASTDSTTSVELSIDESLIGSDPYYGDPSFFFDPQSAVANGDKNQLGQTDDVTIRPPPASGIS